MMIVYPDGGPPTDGGPVDSGVDSGEMPMIDAGLDGGGGLGCVPQIVEISSSAISRDQRVDVFSLGSSFQVVYAERNQSPERVVVVPVNGTERGDDIAFDVPAGEQLGDDPRIGDGVVIWSYTAGDNLNHDVRARTVSSTGALGTIVDVTDSDTVSDRYPDVAQLSNGNIIAAWNAETGPGNNQVLLRSITNNDAPITLATGLERTTRVVISPLPEAGAGETAAALVSWIDRRTGEGEDPDYGDIFIQRIALVGGALQPTGDPLLANDNDANGMIDPTEVRLGNDDVDVAYYNDGTDEGGLTAFDIFNGGRLGINTRLLETTGEFKSTRRNLDTGISDEAGRLEFQRDPAVGTFGGGYVVAYRGKLPAELDENAFIRVAFVHGSDGNVIEHLDVAASGWEDGQTGVAVLDDGRILVTWATSNAAGSFIRGAVLSCADAWLRCSPR